MQKTARHHVEMINSPDEWPRWPVLPMKNGERYNTNKPTHGVILAYHEHLIEQVTVFHTNMFMIPTKQVKNGTHSVIDFEALKAMGYETYPDATAVVDAGWQVD